MFSKAHNRAVFVTSLPHSGDRSPLAATAPLQGRVLFLIWIKNCELPFTGEDVTVSNLWSKAVTFDDGRSLESNLPEFTEV
jgi:hypothetical protein